MLNSSDPKKVGTAVAVLAASAQVLGALTVTRAFAACKRTPLSDVLYAKVGGWVDLQARPDGLAFP